MDNFQSMKEDSFIPALDELFQQKRFFELRDQLAEYNGENSPEILFYQGAVANKFNFVTESIGLLQSYLDTAEPPGEKLRGCFELLGDNFAKNYQYRLAAEKYGWLYENQAGEYAGEKRKQLEYQYNVWTALQDIPPQTVAMSGDSEIQGRRIASNHLEIPVEINGQKIDFIFDTGASLSCITISNAEKLGLRIIDRTISVGTATDIRIETKLAVASGMKFGQVELENVPLLLIKDEDLFLKKRDYQIQGIVGYPVMQACRRVSISKDGRFFIPAEVAEAETAEQNLCFDDMMPLLNIVYKDQPMSFVFDTGGRKSQFWSKFLQSQEAEIKSSARLEMTDFGGAGGRREIPAYILKELPVNVFGKNVRFRKAQILAEPFNDLNRNFFGNIGQDFMMQFDKITIDFAPSNITFE